VGGDTRPLAAGRDTWMLCGRAAGWELGRRDPEAGREDHEWATCGGAAEPHVSPHAAEPSLTRPRKAPVTRGRGPPAKQAAVPKAPPHSWPSPVGPGSGLRSRAFPRQLLALFQGGFQSA
jgi:hypothetical protein